MVLASLPAVFTFGLLLRKAVRSGLRAFRAFHRCSEPLRSKVGGPIKGHAMFCGLELLCQEALKNNSIRFKMNLLKKYQHFMKLSDYSFEMEYRIMVNSEKTDGWFINRDNGILTPYIEKNIVREVEEDNISVPIKWNYSWSCFSGTNG